MRHYIPKILPLKTWVLMFSLSCLSYTSNLGSQSWIFRWWRCASVHSVCFILLSYKMVLIYHRPWNKLIAFFHWVKKIWVEHSLKGILDSLVQKADGNYMPEHISWRSETSFFKLQGKQVWHFRQLKITSCFS